MSLSQEFTGSGAMLARLVELGARAGLTATQTLLHVLDGAPLAGAAGISAVRLRPGLSVDEVRAAADRPVDGATWHPGMVTPVVDLADTLDGLPFVWTDPAELLRIGLALGDDDAAIGFALQAPLKRDRVLTLYGCTGLRPGRIAALAGSTRMSTSFFLNEARKAGDPRVIEGDRARGGPPQMAPQATTADVDVGGERSETELENWQAPDEAPMAVDGDGAEAATAPLNEPIAIPPAGFNGEGGRADPGPDVSPDRAAECAERDAGSSDPGGDVAAFPAPQPLDPAEMGTVRQDGIGQDSDATPDTAARPAGPGLNSADGPDRGTLKDRILGLYGKTTLRVAAIAEQLGKGQNQVSGCIATARAKGDQRVLDGDIARKAVTTMADIAKSVQAPTVAPVTAAPSPPEPEPAPPAAAPSILTIVGNRIDGPTGGLDGFPLVNRILAALADGLERHCDDVATVAGARSGAAVKAVLGQWAKDLTSIGITVAIGNDGGVLLRKAVP